MRLWSLILLCLITVGLHAGDETVPATTPVPATAPASASVAPAVEAAKEATTEAKPVEATPAQATPTYEEYHLTNKLLQVDIIGWQGAIRRVSLLETHPIHLPAWQSKILAAKGQQNPDPAKPLAVLSAFNPHGDNHNWITGLGLEGNPAWTKTQGDDRHLVLSYANTAKNLRYTLTYELPEDALTLRSTLLVENLGTGEATIRPVLYPLNGVHQDDAKQDAAYLALAHHNGGTKGAMTSLSVPPVGTSVDISGDHLDYVCLKSRFFAALWHPLAFGTRDASAPATPAPVAAAAPVGGPGGPGSNPGGPGGPLPAAAPTNRLFVKGYGFTDSHGAHQAYVEAALLGAGSTGDTVLKPGQVFEAAWTTTVVSMKSGDVKHLDEISAKVEFSDWYYRFFSVLVWPLTFCLDWLVLLVQNYGVAVVVLTFLIKLALHRTTFKQHESMMKMQKLAPDLKLLQEQYKNDKQKMAQKQMELWKKHGVNPLGGCLPILIQIPIFTSLYLAFCHSADMRGHGFLWVNDLTLPDQLIGWMVAGWTVTINPLPILYIGVSIWMSLMQKVPPGADPQQEQMMKTMRWLPVIFGVIFYNFPSGLVLYFTVNAVLSTIEIKMVRKKLGMH